MCENTSWEERYRQLEAHHAEETQRLIAELERERQLRAEFEAELLAARGGKPIFPRPCCSCEAMNPGSGHDLTCKTGQALEAERRAREEAQLLLRAAREER